MTRWPLRIAFVTLFFGLAFLLIERQSTSFQPTIRKSRYTDKSTSTLRYPHVGKLQKYTLPKAHFQSSSPLSWLNFDKKINTYYFTFYNWYFFEIEFVDLTYDSYIQFKVWVDDQLHDRWIQRIGFSLDDSFYPKGGNIRSNDSKSCCGKQKGLNFDISNNVLNFTSRQYTLKNMSGPMHDGNQYSRFWYYTPNKTVNDPENDPFKDDLTITQFNISYQGKNRSIDANITHVLRHNQCFSFLDQQNAGTFKHQCVGGYASGRLFLDRVVNHEQLTSYGRNVKSVYNLDNNRTRTAFLGVRSTKALSKQLGSSFPRTNWKWRGFKAFMQCFSKPEYYSKGEKIQKERYVGLHFSRPFEASSKVETFQDYLFYNGKIVPVHAIDYSFNENYKVGKNITFKSAPTQSIKEDLWQPNFQINFTTLSKQQYSQSTLLGTKNELRAYGYWTGWIDEGKKGSNHIEFFNITGYIETANSIY